MWHSEAKSEKVLKATDIKRAISVVVLSNVKNQHGLTKWNGKKIRIFEAELLKHKYEWTKVVQYFVLHGIRLKLVLCVENDHK